MLQNIFSASTANRKNVGQLNCPWKCQGNIINSHLTLFLKAPCLPEGAEGFVVVDISRAESRHHGCAGVSS